MATIVLSTDRQHVREVTEDRWWRMSVAHTCQNMFDITLDFQNTPTIFCVEVENASEVVLDDIIHEE